MTLQNQSSFIDWLFRHKAFLVAALFMVFYMHLFETEDSAGTWDFLPVYLASMIMVNGGILGFKWKKAPVWWYFIMWLCLTVSSWYAFNPHYFIDFQTPREYFYDGTVSLCFFVPLLQMLPFLWIGIWDKWIGKIHEWWMFFVWLVACLSGFGLTFIHPDKIPRRCTCEPCKCDQCSLCGYPTNWEKNMPVSLSSFNELPSFSASAMARNTEIYSSESQKRYTF